MSADPYVTVDDWLGQLDLDDYADTCAAEAYGDQWERMDAYLAEGAVWPRSPIQWDVSSERAQAMAEVPLYDGRYSGQWGVFMMGTRGVKAVRLHERAATDRLLHAIFGEPS